MSLFTIIQHNQTVNELGDALGFNLLYQNNLIHCV